MHTTPHRGHATARPARRPFTLVSLGALLTLRRSRARLAQLDDHILRDIGIDRDAALREAVRPIWDVPAHWRR